MRVVFALFVVGLGACTPKESAPLTPPPRAVAAANALKSELKAALEAAMQNGGPENAIDVCKDKAQAIAAAHSKDGLVVGRTSHKLRNVANAPRAWVQPILEQMARGEVKDARTVALDGGRLGYVEPIVMGPVCVACHGEAIAPGVAAKIAAAYPTDAATGFNPGDVRGVVWVELPR